MTLGGRIRELRTRADMSLQDLADEASISKTYLWQIENDRAEQPSAKKLLSVAEALGTTIAHLLGRPSIEVAGEEIEIPSSLEAFFAENPDIPEEDRRTLAAIQYRGQRPRSIEDWAYIYESIRRATG